VNQSASHVCDLPVEDCLFSLEKGKDPTRRTDTGQSYTSTSRWVGTVSADELGFREGSVVSLSSFHDGMEYMSGMRKRNSCLPFPCETHLPDSGTAAAVVDDVVVAAAVAHIGRSQMNVCDCLVGFRRDCRDCYDG
jgi:hypothetical protein